MRLKSICIIATGKKDANYGSLDGEYPFFTCAKEPIKCKSYSFEGESLLLAGNGDISNISYYSGLFEAYQRTYVLQPYVGGYLQYIHVHLLYNWVEYNNKKMYGSTIPYIRLGNIEEYLVAMPPLAEQQRILIENKRCDDFVSILLESRTRYKHILSDTPTSLRQQLIQAAIQGKLVPQEPSDEPASELLKRIAEERVAKMGKKAAKSATTIVRRGSKTYELFPNGSKKDISDEIPFDIPDSWEWCRIGSIFTLQAGKSISSASISEKSDKSPYPCYGGNGCRGYVEIFNRDGDYPLIGRQGALCGNINRATGKFYATEHAVCVTSYYCVNVDWLCLFLRALNLNQYATATAQPGLAVSTLNEVLFPLPPQEEQNRIAKTIGVLSASMPL